MQYRIEIDTSPLKDMLYTLKKIRYLNKEDLKKILYSRAYRYMLFTNSLSTNDLIEILDNLSRGSEPKEDRLKWIYNEFKNCMENIDKYYSFVNSIELRKAEIIGSAYSRAMKYLSENTEIDVKVYIVIGGSDAYGVNLLDTKAIIMNSTHFLDNIDKFIAILAHEIHHKALWRSREIYWRLEKRGLIILKYIYDIMSEIVGEGVASIVASPYIMMEKYNLLKNNINREYAAVEEGIINIYEKFSEKRAREIFDKLYTNVGPIYMVGIDMALKIEKYLGRKDLIETLEDPTSYTFFKKYVTSLNEMENPYIYSEKLIKILGEVYRKIIEIY